MIGVLSIVEAYFSLSVETLTLEMSPPTYFLALFDIVRHIHIKTKRYTMGYRRFLKVILRMQFPLLQDC